MKTRWRAGLSTAGVFFALTFTAAPASASAIGQPQPDATISLTPPRASSQPPVPVYVVRRSYAGSPENLSEIAQRFLGGSSHAAQIAQANAGIVQSDGGIVTGTGKLRPGWVLVMPANAHGAGLKTGRFPANAKFSPAPMDPLAWILGGFNVLTVLAASAALWWLARRSPSPTARAVPGTTGDRDSWLIDRILRVLFARSEAEGMRPPAPYLLTVGRDRVSVHLASPRATAPVPFHASEGGDQWYADLRDVQETAVDPAVPNPLSALVSVGEANGELVAIDLARADGVVQVDGPPEARRALIAEWGRQLRNAPWADASLPIAVSGFTAGTVPETRYLHSLTADSPDLTGGGPLVLLADELDRRDHTTIGAILTVGGIPRAVVVGGAYPDPRWRIRVGADGSVSSDLFASEQREEEPLT